MDHGPHKVLIAGGGVAALEAALALRALAEGGVEVELVAPEPRFWYRPLAVAEPFAHGEVRHFDLSDLAARAGATVSPGSLVAADAARYEATTSGGAVIPYDALLVACGAVPAPAVPGALTFRGPADTAAVEAVLAEIEAGEVTRAAFVVPWTGVWSLPAYELALMTASWAAGRGIDELELTLVTPEEEPLHLFGPAAVAAVGELLDAHGIAVRTGVHPRAVLDGRLALVPAGVVDADRVVALPRLKGPRLDGIPQTRDGFVPVDAHGRVHGLPGVYAAGDVTTCAVKQGGIAAQQADAAAEAIAADLGFAVEPTPFRPILRGLLLTGSEPRYLRSDVFRAGEFSAASPEPLWWPPAKIVGRHLAPFLAQLAGVASADEAAAEPPGVRVEVELDAAPAVIRSEPPVGGPVVGEVMAPDPLVVAPEDTLGEIAEQMRERDVGSALVADYGRLIGILTSRDLLRAFAGRVHSSEARVREWMTAEPVAVDRGTTLEAAARLMTEHRVHHLPVVDGERPVGMVGFRDVVHVAAPLAGIGLGL